MAKLQSGDKAPEFTLNDQNSKFVSLKDYKGKKVLLYFYPKADTPGCTTQSCSIRDARVDLEKKGVASIGISPDMPDKQANFDTKYNLKFPLLSDPDHKIADLYGVWGEKTSFGKTSMGIIRSSFLIDEKGFIIKAWYKVSPDDTVPNALKEIE